MGQKRHLKIVLEPARGYQPLPGTPVVPRLRRRSFRGTTTWSSTLSY